MKRHWPNLILAIIGMTAIVLLLASLIRPREPTYDGKPLSFWLDQMDDPQSGQAQDAIRAIGPKAVPNLLETVRQENTVHQKHYHTFWKQLPETVQTTCRRLDEPARSIAGSLLHSDWWGAERFQIWWRHWRTGMLTSDWWPLVAFRGWDQRQARQCRP